MGFWKVAHFKKKKKDFEPVNGFFFGEENTSRLMQFLGISLGVLSWHFFFLFCKNRFWKQIKEASAPKNLILLVTFSVYKKGFTANIYKGNRILIFIF